MGSQRTHLQRTTLLSLALFMSVTPGCGSGSFSGAGAKFATGRSNPRPSQGGASKLEAKFNFTLDGKTFSLSAQFAPKSTPKDASNDYSVQYDLVQDSIKSTAGDGFPQNLADALAKVGLTAKVTHNKSNLEKPYSIEIIMSAKALVLKDETIGDKNFNLSQSGGESSWNKDEGDVVTGTPKSSTFEACKIKGSGLQPAANQYFTLLTLPASCDFKLPTITAGYNSSHVGEVAIGTYWRYFYFPEYGTNGRCNGRCTSVDGAWDVAHSFPYLDPIKNPGDLGKIPKTNGSQPGYVTMDNGFLLAQPDGQVYLLADAGIACRGNTATFHSTEIVAKDMLMTLKSKYPDIYKVDFKGLRQPVSGSVSDNYLTSTVFQTGSVIAVYDDTPDMSGTVDVATLTTKFLNVGLTLQWDAKLVAK